MQDSEKTLRDKEIVRLMKFGEPIEKIADTLCVSPIVLYQICTYLGRKKFSHLNSNYKEEKYHG